MQWYYNIIL